MFSSNTSKASGTALQPPSNKYSAVIVILAESTLMAFQITSNFQHC